MKAIHNAKDAEKAILILNNQYLPTKDETL
jgi:hypothetical protein